MLTYVPKLVHMAISISLDRAKTYDHIQVKRTSSIVASYSEDWMLNRKKSASFPYISSGY